jgi:PiT family inorganic phosphate transporter
MTWSIGANDVANAIGTAVGSHALTLKQAVVLAAILEFCGAFFFGSHVTQTIEEGVINTSHFYHEPLTLVFGMLAVLLGAGSWLVIASYFGLPVSTTHSIVGALVGFAVAVGGWEAVYWDNVASIATSWVASPLIGGVLGYTFFHFLRRNILFSQEPVAATKKFTPWIIFVFVFIFTFVFCYQDFPQFESDPSLLFSFVAAFAAALIAMTIAIYLLKKVQVPPDETYPLVHHPDFTHEVEKAKRYLRRLESYSKGSVKGKLSSIAGEFDQVSSELVASATDELHIPNYQIVEKVFSKLQILSASMMAFSHGANDVANAIGPLAVAVNVLMNGQYLPNNPASFWLLALGGLGIVLGLATWGWRVIETIGKRITELTPTRGFSAEFAAATTILVASRLGFPISATHTLVGAVLGVGFARGIEALNLATIRDIIASWMVTIPVGAASAIGFFYIIEILL